MTSERLVSSGVFWVIFNASQTKKTMMYVSRSSTMHPHVVTPLITIGRPVLKESNHLHILGVTFDSMMTFDKHLCSVSKSAC